MHQIWALSEHLVKLMVDAVCLSEVGKILDTKYYFAVSYFVQYFVIAFCEIDD